MTYLFKIATRMANSHLVIALAIGFAFGLNVGLAEPTSLAAHLAHISHMVGHWLSVVATAWASSSAFYIPATWVGALVAQVMSLRGACGNSIAFLKRNWPGHGETLYYRADTVIMPTVGSVAVFMLHTPESMAMAFGLGLASSTVIRAALHYYEKVYQALQNKE